MGGGLRPTRPREPPGQEGTKATLQPSSEHGRRASVSMDDSFPISLSRHLSLYNVVTTRALAWFLGAVYSLFLPNRCTNYDLVCDERNNANSYVALIAIGDPDPLVRKANLG